MIKAVIFDLDGLILDTEIIENQAYEKLLRDYGKTPEYNPNGLIHIIGMGHAIYEIIKKKYQVNFPRPYGRGFSLFQTEFAQYLLFLGSQYTI